MSSRRPPDKGINADEMVLTVIAAKVYAQVNTSAAVLLDVAIKTDITVAPGQREGALTSSRASSPLRSPPRPL